MTSELGTALLASIEAVDYERRTSARRTSTRRGPGGRRRRTQGPPSQSHKKHPSRGPILGPGTVEHSIAVGLRVEAECQALGMGWYDTMARVIIESDRLCV